MRRGRRSSWLQAALIASFVAGADATAEEPTPAEQKEAPTAFNTPPPAPEPADGPQWGAGDGKSWWAPAGNILLYETLLNLYDRHYVEPLKDYRSTMDSFREHLRGGWAFDNDNFQINQFGHPYSGSMYHGFARAGGLGYWPSLGYTFAGSLVWEEAGETTKPSLNDQVMTGIGGTFLGEPLFRMASLVLENGDGSPSAWRSIAASFVSPATGATRLFYRDRFDGVFTSRNPAVYTRAQLGANLNASLSPDVKLVPDPSQPPVPQEYRRGEAIADFTMIYGLPGKPGYDYTRPFDYFTFQLTTAAGNPIEHLITRGLLLGEAYGTGASYRGIWGLYGSYDYIAPQIFRVSTTSLGVGTTGQWWIGRSTALQDEAILGIGYGEGGEIHGAGQRNYHYGVTPQGQMSLRLILSDRAAFEVAARDYYVSDRASAEDGTENIARGEAGFTLRVFGLHGITVKYTISHRDARYAPPLFDTTQTVAAVSVGYTYIGHRWFGAVDWRDSPPSD